MLRRSLLLVPVLTFIVGSFAFFSPAPAMAQSAPGCWELVDSGSFDGSIWFNYFNFAAGTFGPDDALLFEVHSTTVLTGAHFAWVAGYPAITAADAHNYSNLSGFTEYSFIFHLDQVSGPYPPLTSEQMLLVQVAAEGETLPPDGTWGIWVEVACENTDFGQPVYVDGRLCIWDTYAVYTDEDSIDVYRISNSRGSLILSVSQDEIDAVGENPDTNVLIESDPAVQVYALAGGETYEVHVAPFIFGGSRFVRFRGLPAEDIFCDVVH